MNIVKRIIKWVIDLGVKCLISLVRTASEVSGTPVSKLPTEKEIVWELGTTVAKRVVNSKLKMWWSSVSEPVRNFCDWCRGITLLRREDVVQHNDKTLVLDV